MPYGGVAARWWYSGIGKMRPDSRYGGMRGRRAKGGRQAPHRGRFPRVPAPGEARACAVDRYAGSRATLARVRGNHA